MRVFTIACACFALVACNRSSTGGAALASAEDSVSYIIGYQVGGNLRHQELPVNPDIVLRGLRDGFGGATAALSEEQMRATATAYQQRTMQAARQRDSVAAIRNAEEAEKFFAANRKKAGVTTTPSGLQWKVLKEGKGPRPTPHSTVRVHYRGTLLNGDEFDSSRGGDPVSFQVGGVIPGWTEGIQLMSAGAKYQFWIPADLAYGRSGYGPKIGPNAALIFEVELVSFE